VSERVLLVGEMNPISFDPRYALYPLPENCTGGRLCKILGLSAREYLRTFDRVNLVRRGAGKKWQATTMRMSADLLKHRRRILLGARVCTAHRVPFRPFRTFRINETVTVLVLPHPSGRNRIWNDPASAVRTRRAVARFLRKEGEG